MEKADLIVVIDGGASSSQARTRSCSRGELYSNPLAPPRDGVRSTGIGRASGPSTGRERRFDARRGRGRSRLRSMVDGSACAGKNGCVDWEGDLASAGYRKPGLLRLIAVAPATDLSGGEAEFVDCVAARHPGWREAGLLRYVVEVDGDREIYFAEASELLARGAAVDLDTDWQEFRSVVAVVDRGLFGVSRLNAVERLSARVDGSSSG